MGTMQVTYRIDRKFVKKDGTIYVDKDKKVTLSYWAGEINGSMAVEIPIEEETITNMFGTTHIKYLDSKKFIIVKSGKNIFYKDKDYEHPLHNVKAEKTEAYQKLQELQKKPYRSLKEPDRWNRVKNEIILVLPDELPEDEYKEYTTKVVDQLLDDIYTGRLKFTNIKDFVRKWSGASNEDKIEVT